MDTYRLFTLATLFVNRAPEPVGRAVFDIVGRISGVLPLGGVRQLRANYRRLDPSVTGLGALRASVAGMRNYMRYYFEIFYQARVRPEQLPYRCWVVNPEFLNERVNAKTPIIATLMHTGNWDLAGAWSEKHLTHVVTVAEKLADPRMAETFLDFREGLGMKIYPAVAGEGVFEHLEKELEEPVLVPLLADRDLTATGVTVRLAGHEMMVAPGPAALAVATGHPVVPLMMRHVKLTGEHRTKAGTRWGNEILAFPPIYPEATAADTPEVRRADVARISQDWISSVTGWLRDNYRHWHMLQKVFVDDLDQERLARARARGESTP